VAIIALAMPKLLSSARQEVELRVVGKRAWGVALSPDESALCRQRAQRRLTIVDTAKLKAVGPYGQSGAARSL
jgi:hypothetical protein